MKKIIRSVMLFCFMCSCLNLVTAAAESGELSPTEILDLGNHAYYLFDDSMTWNEAKVYCEKIGGHLVTITSEEEQKNVEKLMQSGAKKQYWIGMQKKDGELMWVTREEMTYSNWDSGEPNSHSRADGQSEDYIHIYNQANPAVSGSERFKWNDMYHDNTYPGEESFFCTENVGFICEWEAFRWASEPIHTYDEQYWEKTEEEPQDILETIIPGIWGVTKNGKKDYVDSYGNSVGFDASRGRYLTKTLYQIESSGKYGVVDSSGNLIIPVEYDYIQILYDKFFILILKDKYGVTDLDGNILVPFEYDDITTRTEDFILLRKKNDKYALFNINTQKTILLDYDGLSTLGEENDLLFVAKKDNKYGMLDTAGNVIIPLEYEYIAAKSDTYFSAKKNGKYGVIDIGNNIIIPFDYDYIDRFSDHFFSVYKGEKCGIIDKKGNIIIPFEYESCVAFNNNIFAMKVNANDKNCVIIDINTNIKHTLNFSYIAKILSDTMFVVSEDYYCGIADINNNIIVPLEYDLGYYSSEVLYTLHKDHKSFIIFSREKNAVLFECDSISTMEIPGTRDLWKIKKDDKYGIMHTNGNIILPCEYNDIVYTQFFIYARTNNKTLVLDFDGNIVLSSDYYISEISDSYFCAGKDDKYGIVDIYGNVVVPMEYTYPHIERDYDIIKMSKNSDTTEIRSKDGKLLSVLNYGSFLLRNISDTHFIVYKGGYGVVDITGKIIVPTENNSISEISNTIFAVNNSLTNTLCILRDINGNRVVETDFTKVVVNKNDNICALALRNTKGKWGFAFANDKPKFTDKDVPESENVPQSTINPAAVSVTIPTFNITINNGKVANTNALYPCITYKDITYFPMTYSGSRSLGLTADWTAETGLVIEKTDTAPYIPKFEQNSVPNTSGNTATPATGNITVNGKAINNSEEEYPLLVFRDITYFPLTWRFAVEEFGWDYSFTSEKGLSISCK